MTLWLIYNQAEIQKNKHYIQMYQDACRRRGIAMRLVVRQTLSPEELTALPDIAVNRSRDAFLSQWLESAGVRVFNNSFVTEICNDKWKTFQYLKGKGIPMMETALCTNALQAEQLTYPVVLKSRGGHGGNEVFLVQDAAELHSLWQKTPYTAVGAASGEQKNYIVQRCADTPGRDLRVYVIGNTPVAAMLRQSDTDFRSNFSLGGHASPHKLTDDERALVQAVLSQFQFGLVGVDLIYDNGRPVLNEIEDVVGARMLYQHTDIDLVGLYIDWMINEVHEGTCFDKNNASYE